MPHNVVFPDLTPFRPVGECQCFSGYNASSFTVPPPLLLVCFAVKQKAIIQLILIIYGGYGLVTFHKQRNHDAWILTYYGKNRVW